MRITFQSVAFGRRPTESEQIKGRKAIKDGLDFLEKRNVSIIIPQTSFPTNKNDDMGIGSPYTKSGKIFSKNIAWWGFNTQQYLPSARLEHLNPVPYVGSVFSSNELIINLKELTEEKWGHILDNKIYEDIINSKPEHETISTSKSYDPESPDFKKIQTKTLGGDNIIYYNYAWSKFDTALISAFNKLKAGMRNDEKLAEIYSRFQEFANNPDNNYWLEKDSIYYTLAEYYGSEYYPDWKGKSAEIDKNLFNRDIVSETAFRQRMQQINSDPFLKEKNEFYKFKQFILFEQNKDYKQYCEKIGAEIAEKIGETNKENFTIKTLDDASSGLGNSQKWGYPDIFIKGWTMGCLPDGNWQYKLLDFKKLYNPDGTLSSTGKFLYNKFSKSFRENGGIRIDHSQGYINPQVTPEGKSISNEKSGKLRTSDNGTDFFKEYLVFDEKKEGIENITPEELDELGQIFDIIIKAAKDNGVSKEDIMFEAFDDQSGITDLILKKKGLGKIMLARWNTDYFGNNEWATLGNHDNDSLREWTNALFDGKNLYGTLGDYTAHLKKELALTEEEVNSIINNKDIEQAKKNFIKYQFVKLFASKAQNIQVFFTDFFGLEERYQRANVPDPQNWRIKVHTNYEEEYYQKLAEGYGLNMPEVISLAIQHKARKENIELPEYILLELNKYSNILKS